MMSARDQVIGAITTHKRPLTLTEIFNSCDCFEHKTDAAKLINVMVGDFALTSFRPGLEPARYGVAGMSYVTPAAARAKQALAKEVATNDAGAPPNAEEATHARRASIVKPLADKEIDECTLAMPSAEPPVFMPHARVGPLEQQDARDADEVLELLRANFTEAEFRGYLRGNLIVLGLRGRPEDLKRQQTFANALAEMAS